MAAAAAIVAAPGGRADEPSLGPRYDVRADGVVTGAAAAGTLTLELLKKELAPVRCRWCNPSGFEADLASSLRWRSTAPPSRASDVLAFGLGAGALAYTVYQGYGRQEPGSGWANALLVTEATSVAMLLDTSVKYAAGRQRPYAWRGEAMAGDRYDRNLSFFSGHTTFTFAVAASSSTLLMEQQVPHAREYAWVAYGAAATTAYLRLAADKHYASDVLVGAAVGTFVGWAIPHYLHGPTRGGVRLAPAPGGIALIW